MVILFGIELVGPIGSDHALFGNCRTLRQTLIPCQVREQVSAPPLFDRIRVAVNLPSRGLKPTPLHIALFFATIIIVVTLCF